MKFPLAALGFLVGSFILFCFFVFSALLVGETSDAIRPLAVDLGETSFINMIDILPTILGILCAIFFVTGLLLYFILESLSDESEYYYR